MNLFYVHKFYSKRKFDDRYNKDINKIFILYVRYFFKEQLFMKTLRIILKQKKKLFLFIVFLLVICTILIQLNSHLSLQKQERQLNINLQSKVKQLDAWIHEKKQLLKNLAYTLELVDFSGKTYLPFMQKTLNLMEVNSIFSGFSDGQYFDTQGYWIKGFDPRTRPWYKETINTDKITTSGPMYYTDITGKKITWWAFSSVLKRFSKPFGVVSVEVLPSMLNSQLKKPSIDGIDLLLIDKKTHHIIASTHKYYEEKLCKDVFSPKVLKEIKLLKDKPYVTNINNHAFKIYLYSLKEAPWLFCAIKRLDKNTLF